MMPGAAAGKPNFKKLNEGPGLATAARGQPGHSGRLRVGPDTDFASIGDHDSEASSGPSHLTSSRVAHSPTLVTAKSVLQSEPLNLASLSRLSNRFVLLLLLLFLVNFALNIVLALLSVLVLLVLLALF